MRLAIALATSGLYPAHAGADTQPTHATVRHSAHDFAKAKAMAPLPPLAPWNETAPMRADHRPETDGLSRNDEDCNFGCIDH